MIENSDSAQISFFEMPRTGSGSLQRLLCDCKNVKSIRHASLEDAKNIIAQSQWVFTFVRNPYDRLVSAYNWIKSGGTHSRLDKESQEVISHYKTVSSFVDNLEEVAAHKSCVHFFPMSWWISDASKSNRKNPKILVNKICYYERSRSEIFRLVLEKKIPIKCLWSQFKKINTIKSKFISFEEFYIKPSTKKKVYLFYQTDFELFNYKP